MQKNSDLVTLRINTERRRGDWLHEQLQRMKAEKILSLELCKNAWDVDGVAVGAQKVLKGMDDK